MCGTQTCLTCLCVFMCLCLHRPIPMFFSLQFSSQQKNGTTCERKLNNPNNDSNPPPHQVFQHQHQHQQSTSSKAKDTRMFTSSNHSSQPQQANLAADNNTPAASAATCFSQGSWYQDARVPCHPLSATTAAQSSQSSWHQVARIFRVPIPANLQY